MWRTTISKVANNNDENVFASRRNWTSKRSTVGGRSTIVSSVKTPPSSLVNEPTITARKANGGDAAKNADGVVGREEEEARVQDNEDEGPKITRDGDKDEDDDDGKDDDNAGHQDFASRRNWASNLGTQFAVAASRAPPPPSRTSRVFVVKKKEKDEGEENTVATKKDKDETGGVAPPPPPQSSADASHDDNEKTGRGEDERRRQSGNRIGQEAPRQAKESFRMEETAVAHQQRRS